jgi:hypothetical protein
LGRRLKAAGYAIAINKSIQVKHLKRWTLTSLVKTDVFDRAIPWTLLINSERKIPDDLNLEGSQRLSALFTALLLMFMAASALFHSQVLVLPILFGLFWFLLRCWQWQEQPVQFEVGWRSSVMVVAFLGLLIGGTVTLHLTSYLPPMLVLLGIIIFGPSLTRRGRLWRQAVFFLMLVAIAAGVMLVITTYPIWMTALILVILSMFILVNRKFYAFFKQKRGVMFAISVIPFHMLYFLYSLAGFGLGTLMYARKSRRIFAKQHSGGHG